MNNYTDRNIRPSRRIAAILAAGGILWTMGTLTAGAETPDTAHMPASAGDEAAGAAHCQPLHGTFVVQALPDDLCDSPAGRCTVGQFNGALSGDYELILEALAPSPVANIFFYSGSSSLRLLRGGAVMGTDSGTIDFDPGRFGHFASVFTFTGDTGAAAAVTGQVIMQGRLDFRGGGSGTYTGSLCTAE